MSASHIRIDTVIETGDGCFGQNGFRKDLPYLHLQYYNGEGRKSKVLPPPLLPPQGDCVAIMMEGGFRRNPAVAGSGSSALECGHLKLRVIGLLRNGILFMGLEP